MQCQLRALTSDFKFEKIEVFEKIESQKQKTRDGVWGVG
jgi:hypothetical protein